MSHRDHSFNHVAQAALLRLSMKQIFEIAHSTLSILVHHVSSGASQPSLPLTSQSCYAIPG